MTTPRPPVRARPRPRLGGRHRRRGAPGRARPCAAGRDGSATGGSGSPSTTSRPASRRPRPAVLAALAAGVTSTLRVGSAAVLLGLDEPGRGRRAVRHHRRRAPRARGPRPRAGVVPAARRTRATRRRAVPDRAPGASEDRVVDGLLVPADPPFSFRDPDLLARFVAQQRYLSAGRTPGAFTDELRTVLDLQAGTARADDGRDAVSPAVAGLGPGPVGARVERGGERPRRRRAGPAARRELPREPVDGPGDRGRLPGRVPARRARRAVRRGVGRRARRRDRRARPHALADPFAAWVLSIRSGARAIPYPRPGTTTPWDERPDDERALLRDRIDTRLVGDASSVAAGLDALVRATGADELLLTTITHDPSDTARSYELLAREWGLQDRRPRRRGRQVGRLTRRRAARARRPTPAAAHCSCSAGRGHDDDPPRLGLGGSCRPGPARQTAVWSPIRWYVRSW